MRSNTHSNTTSPATPNNRYVIDPGRVKRRVFDARSGTSRFEVSWVSQAAAEQRAGRAGRTGPGHVYRLYSSAVFQNTFERFEEPEMLKSPVEALVLQLTSLGIGDAAAFPFPSAPPPAALATARSLLLDLGALEAPRPPAPAADSAVRRRPAAALERLTPLGELLAKLPLSPPLAKVLVLAWQQQAAARSRRNTAHPAWNLLEYALRMVACMAAQPPFVLPSLRDSHESGAARADLAPKESGSGRSDDDVSVAASDEISEDGDDEAPSSSIAREDADVMRRGRGVDQIAEQEARAAGLDSKAMTPEQLDEFRAGQLAAREAEAARVEARRVERVRQRTLAHAAHARMRNPRSDALTLLRTLGAYTYAVASAEDSPSGAGSAFCRDNFLRLKSMKEAAQLVGQLRRLVEAALGSGVQTGDVVEISGGGDAAEDGAVAGAPALEEHAAQLPPPSPQTETLLMQLIAAGFLSRVARRAPPDQIAALSAAARVGRGRAWVPYMPASSTIAQDAPLIFVHPGSAVDEADARLMPEFICFSEIVHSVSPRTGKSRAYARGVSAVEERWLSSLAAGTPLSSLGPPLETPAPVYSARSDAVVCARVPTFGDTAWRLAPIVLPLLLPAPVSKAMRAVEPRTDLLDTAVRAFARALLEGKAVEGLLPEWAAAPPSLITQRSPQKRVALLVEAMLAKAIVNAASLAAAWSDSPTLLFSELGAWIGSAHADAYARWWRTRATTRLHPSSDRRNVG